MLKVPKVKSAIFGLPLATGTKIIGFIHVVLYTLFFIVVIVKEREDHSHDHSPATENSTAVNSTEAINGTFFDGLDDEVIHESFLDLSASYFNDFALLVQMTFAAFLLLGIYQKNLDFIMSWVLLQIANIIFSLFFVVVYFVAVFRIYATGYVQYLICEEITVTLVVGYCVIVVNSYVEEVTKKTNEREEQMSPIVINQEAIR